MIYSDGLTEAENAEGEFFDTERLRDCLRDNCRDGAAELHAALLGALDHFSEGGVIRDDITALVLEYAPASSDASSIPRRMADSRTKPFLWAAARRCSIIWSRSGPAHAPFRSDSDHARDSGSVRA